MAGSRAIRVPNAVGVIRRRASISSANGSTGIRTASPDAAARIPKVEVAGGLRDADDGCRGSGDGTVSESAPMPVKRSPIRWVSRM